MGALTTEIGAEFENRLPSAADVAFYTRHGWWVSPPCIAGAQLNRLNLAIERYYAGERNFALTTVSGNAWSEDPGAGVKRGSFLSLLMADVRAFVLNPLLGQMAARLAGCSEIRLFHDQVWYKEPAAAGYATELDWHTDKTFWKTCSSSDMLTAWIPLQDCTLEMGPLGVVDASHHWEGTECGAFERTRLPRLGAERSSEADEAPVEHFTLRRGQVAFHHCRTIHGSGPNRSPYPRAALCVHYQNAANAYQAAVDSSGRPVRFMLDELCARDANGLPNYSDPNVCPRLWPQ